MLALAEVGVAHALFDPVRWREFYAQGGDGIAGLGHGLAAEGAVGVAGLQTVAEGQVVGDGAGGEAAGGWMTPKDKRKPHKHFKDGKWNAYRVLAQGPRIQVWINGKQISDLVHEEKFKSHPKGFIGLQVHGIRKGTGPFEVSWRNIEIIELK